MPEHHIKPLKKFGQNYLQDRNILQKIFNLIDPQPDDNLIEIGPGEGALTAFLYERVPGLTLVEIDTRVIDQLKADYPAAHLINQDFLKTDLAPFISRGKMRVVGNIPYNITSPIFFRLMENRDVVRDATFLIQFEVAQRIIAKPRTKEYGILSVLLQAFATPTIAFKVSPNVFFPKPKVTSAVINLVFKPRLENDPDDRMYIRVVKAAFSKRRKTMRNAFKESDLGSCDQSDSPIDLGRRAEELTVEEFKTLARFFAERLRHS